jgi:hypothetical protein
LILKSILDRYMKIRQGDPCAYIEMYAEAAGPSITAPFLEDKHAAEG